MLGPSLSNGLRAAATQADSAVDTGDVAAVEPDVYVSLIHKDTAIDMTAYELTFFEDTSFRVLNDVGFAGSHHELESLEIHQLSDVDSIPIENENETERKLLDWWFKYYQYYNPKWRGYGWIYSHHCRFCSNDDYYAGNRVLSAETEIDLKAVGDALCDALREGPYEACKGLEQCTVTPAHA